MRNQIAEWVLSQVAPTEQAKAMLGDLLEAQPGPVEFWVGVLRATMSLAVHQPRRVFKKLTGVASYIGISVLFIGLLMRYAGQSFWSAAGILIFNELFAFWRTYRKRVAQSRKIA